MKFLVDRNVIAEAEKEQREQLNEPGLTQTGRFETARLNHIQRMRRSRTNNLEADSLVRQVPKSRRRHSGFC